MIELLKFMFDVCLNLFLDVRIPLPIFALPRCLLISLYVFLFSWISQDLVFQQISSMSARSAKVHVFHSLSIIFVCFLEGMLGVCSPLYCPGFVRIPSVVLQNVFSSKRYVVLCVP